MAFYSAYEIGINLQKCGVKPFIKDTTLVCIDTTKKAHLAVRAIDKSLEECSFPSVKLLTNNPSLKYSVAIGNLDGLAAYSKFCIRELTKFVDTPFCLMVQSDGYVVNGQAWTDEFYKYDWGGAPWNPSGVIGNGGASWRSKRLLNACAELKTFDNEHPEDQWISVRHRAELEAYGIKVMPFELANRFSFEGRAYDGVEWRSVPNKWAGQFCFHSHLSVLPPSKKSCKIFHSSGDMGDTIYGCAVIKALGGGTLFLSPHNNYPYPLNSRWSRTGGTADWVDNLKPLLEAQPYIWRAQYTHGTPFSTDVDLNKFREPWKNRTARDFESILSLNCRAFNVPIPTEPWLTVTDPIIVPDRPIVVARSERYRDDSFPWPQFVQRWGDKMIFVGLEKEWMMFKGFGAPKFSIPWYETKDCLELARVIAGATMIVANQSLPLAIAHGLGKAVCIERWKQNPNCDLQRPNVLYSMPKEWL